MTLHIDDELDSTRASAPTLGRSLCRFDDGDVFAIIERGNEFFRFRDHELWATERDGLLVSARSGDPLAVRRGKVFFAVDSDEPLYYERAL